jgi:hypothetical protein
MPTREEGLKLTSEDYPVMVAYGGIGWLGWILPKINLLDLNGLNDYVIARSPARPKEVRIMAHDRIYPAEYVAAFQPNVFFTEDGIVRVKPREKPLRAEDIQAIEGEWRKRVRRVNR